MNSQRLMGVVFALLLALLAATTSWAASISGSLTNTSGKTGRAYIMLTDQYKNSNGFGTSVAISSGSGSTPFTVSGVPDGSYQISGYLDTRNSGHIYSGSPLFGTGTLVPVSGSDVSGLNYSIDPAPAQSVATPTSINAAPMDSGLFVIFDTPTINGIEVADSYNIYWSTSPNPSASQMAGGGSLLDIPSVNDGHQGIPGLTNGTAYYVAVEAVIGTSKSGLMTTGPVTAGNPGGGFTLSGTVTFNGISPAKPLIIVAYSNNGIYLTRIANPTVSQAYTIQGVQAGSYSIGAFLDQNDNRRIDDGDLNTGFDKDVPVTVSGDMNLPGITLTNQNVSAGVTTRHSSFGQGGDGYDLAFSFRGQAKRPTHIEVGSGTGMTSTSLTFNEWGELRLTYPVAKPTVGDSYSATVHYSDGTSETVSGLTVSGRVDVLPVVTYPNGSTGPDGTSPRFAWYLTGLPAGNYSQNLQLYSNGGDDWRVSVPITQHSYKYDGPTLSTGNQYNGQIEISDPLGNVSQSFFQFQPTSTPLTVSGVTPSALVCGSATAITIDGTGFANGNPNLHQVYFNTTTPATVNWVSSAQINVTLPSCTSGSAVTGPVTVSVNGVSAVQQGDFAPQVFYDYYVKGSNNSLLPGAVDVSLEGTSTTTTSDPANGHYHLPGISSGIPFQLQFSLSGYLNSYSGRMQLLDNYTDTSGNYGLFTAAEAGAWGVGASAGVIRSRVADNTGVNMAGAVVSAYSTRYNSSNHYTVAYTDPNNAALLVSGAGRSTHTDGRFYVQAVEEGDTVVVTAAKADYSFNKRTFVTHANAVSQGRVTGTPMLSVSGMSPAAAPTGSTVVISGTNFNATANQNSVCFQNSMGGTYCTNPSSASMTQLTVVVPCGSGSGAVTVTANGQTVSAGTLTVPAPVITGFTPANGPTGLPVTITGTGFSSGICSGESNVTFAGMPYQQITGSSATQIVFTTPYVGSTTSGSVSVTTLAGTATSSGNYTAYPLPQPNGYISSAMAAPGELVTVYGSYYDFTTANYTVTVGGVAATVTSVNSGGLVFTVPANAGSGGQVVGTYYGNQAYGPSLTVIYHLTAALVGNGTINSTNGYGGLTCPTSSSCSANFYYNELASLAASPSSGYDFSGWSGDCGGTGDCTMNMTANKAVTATFTLQSNIKIGSAYYPTIQAAFDGAANNDIIQARDMDFIENVSVDQNGKSITFKGGYPLGYGTPAGMTSFSKLTLTRGTVTVDRLTIK